MNDIITVDPESILASSKSEFFIVVWSTSQGTFFGTGGGGFQNVIHGNMNSPVVERKNAVEEYYNLVSAAKSHSMITDGRIDLLQIPTFDS